MYIQMMALELQSYKRTKDTCHYGHLQKFPDSVDTRIQHTCLISRLPHHAFTCLGTKVCGNFIASWCMYTRGHVFLHVLVCTYGKECALSVLTVFNCCFCVLIMSEEDGVHANEAAQGKLQGEVMSVLGKVRGNENCYSQKSLWCE
jgi:predicted NAD-dependent protein-ADP-ribosyltransferase YbiA (DUF1768 family)